MLRLAETKHQQTASVPVYVIMEGEIWIISLGQGAVRGLEWRLFWGGEGFHLITLLCPLLFLEVCACVCKKHIWESLFLCFALVNQNTIDHYAAGCSFLPLLSRLYMRYPGRQIYNQMD